VQFGPVNWIAIAAAVGSAFVIGSLWYSPLLFVNSWLKMSGVYKSVFDAGLRKALFADLLSAAATALILNQILRWSGATGAASGLFVGLLVWTGFVASALITQVTYEHRPFAFFAISSGYRLVTLELMGAILSAGRPVGRGGRCWKDVSWLLSQLEALWRLPQSLMSRRRQRLLGIRQSAKHRRALVGCLAASRLRSCCLMPQESWPSKLT
jgi:hypothetical protein